MTGTLDGLFDAATTRRPGNVALKAGNTELTYAELSALATQAAQDLAAYVGPGDCVGLLATRSIATYGAYLGILRAGATVVPMNPDYPPARQHVVARATGLRVIVADDATAQRAAEIAAAGEQTVRVHTITDAGVSACVSAAARRPAAPAVRSMSIPDGIAYIMFTSGSTGNPKGVPIRHRHVVPVVEWWVHEFRYDDRCRAAQTTEFTFDPSVTDVFPAWAAGGTVVVPRRQDVVAPVPFVQREEITHWFSVPPVAELAARGGALLPGCMPSLRAVMFGADRLFHHQARSWAQAAPNAEVWNSYGPTEVSIMCVGNSIGAHGDVRAAAANGTMPIGRVLDHLDHVVLGDDGWSATTGELCVRGPQRFDGYLDPADNAGRFLRWSPGERATILDASQPSGPDDWYRTGDTVTIEGDLLVFAGRRDGQTKIRGHRIEVGEVEAAITRHPRVNEAVVVVHGTGSGAHLVAFHTGDAVPAKELIGLVRAQLPLFMLPSRFVHRPALPMTGNGKVDREALAATGD